MVSTVLAGSVTLSAELRSSAAQDKPAAVITAATTVAGIRQSEIIGYSRQHRPIVAYEMGNRSASVKAVVLGSMHGYRERAGEQVVAAILRMPVSTLIDLWVIPTMNPDGDALGQRGNAAGVDLNRNFPVGWAPIPRSADKFDTHYSGPRPLSEPESLAMYRFLIRVHPRRMVSLHQPLDAVDTTDGGARDIPFRNALSANLALPRSPLTCWSECHGSMTRWLTATQTGSAITVEFPQTVSTAYLSGQAARGILGALVVGVKPPPPHMVGHLDVLRVSPFHVVLAGWVLDPARPAAAGIASLSIDGRAVRNVPTNLVRQDVNRVMKVTGAHGFSASVPTTIGEHRICVTAHAAATTSVAALLAACRVVTVPPFSFQGHVDHISPKPRAVHVSGWALDPLHPTGPVWVRVIVDGRTVANVHTLILRPSVNKVMRTTGTHGFDVTVVVAAGRHAITVVPVGVATTSAARVLAAVTVAVPAR